MFYILITLVIILSILFILYKLNVIIDFIKSQNLATDNQGSQDISNSSIISSEKNIPKIIIQTWKTNTVPQRYMGLINSVKTNNPDYEYLFFTDDTIDKFLKFNYPEYYTTYNSLPVKIQKIDFFRYIAVYHYGGIYLDLDMNVLRPFDDILKYSCVFPVDEYIDTRHCKLQRYKPFCDVGQNFLLGQYAFAASPKHPFIKKLIDNIHNNINKYIRNVDFNSQDYIYKSTGPDFVTEVYTKYNDKKGITILDVGRRQFFGNYAQHNYFGTWK